ncbi:MAG: hypothetical protein LUK37_08860 [Clostridia bacterium]|nr:hypothetical protein [Clostridia bacterium]
MARTQKFPENLLLEAVVKYAETEKGKIKATELAAWAALNIKGLEGVRDYHFMRPVREVDPRTGKQKENKKPCTLRMEEINQARSLTESVKRNTLLKASTIEAFMDQPDYVQRRQIADTRETVDRILAKNASLAKENGSLQETNRELESKLAGLSEKVEALRRTQMTLSRKVLFLMKATDEASRKAILTEMGIEDQEIDLNTYTQSLSLDIREVMDITKAVTRHVLAYESIPKEAIDGQSNASLSDSVFAGLHFGEETND